MTATANLLEFTWTESFVMDAFPDHCLSFYFNVLHRWCCTFANVGDAGEIFLDEHWFELLIQNISSGSGVILEKSILVLQWRYTREFLSFVFHKCPEFLLELSLQSSLTVFSMYDLLALLILYCTSLCRRLYLSKSLLAFVLLPFLQALCFLLIILFISVFIHGLVCRDVVILDGTLFSIVLKIAVFRHSQAWLISFCPWISLVRSFMSSFIRSTSALFQRYIFLRGGLGCVALIEVSKSTMSWSLLAIDGIGLHNCLKLGWAVSIRSKILSLRVGKSTICSRLLSATMSRNVLLSLLEYWELEIVRSLQLISEKLKSPPVMSTLFLALVLRSENSSVTVSM